MATYLTSMTTLIVLHDGVEGSTLVDSTRIICVVSGILVEPTIVPVVVSSGHEAEKEEEHASSKRKPHAVRPVRSAEPYNGRC